MSKFADLVCSFPVHLWLHTTSRSAERCLMFYGGAAGPSEMLSEALPGAQAASSEHAPEVGSLCEVTDMA